jgi:hypothetical protein
VRWWGCLAASLVGVLAVVDCGGGQGDPEDPVGLPGRSPDAKGDGGVTDASVNPAFPSSGDATTPVNGDRECDPNKPFGAPVLLFDPAMRGATPRLSADELTIYFTADGATTGTDLFRAVRTSRQATFGPATAMTAQSSSANDNDPAPSADHLTLFFHSARSGNAELYTASRASLADDFGPASLVPDVNDPAAADAHADYRSAGGGELFFVSNRGGSATYRIHAAKRAGQGYAMPSLVAGLAGAWNDWQPMVTEDGLTMVFASDRPGGKGGFDLWTTSRASDGADWGEPVPIDELGSAAAEFAGWISADRCRLYFSSSRDTTNDATQRLYVAARPF